MLLDKKRRRRRRVEEVGVMRGTLRGGVGGN